MSKQNSSSVRVQDVVNARRLVAEQSSFTLSGRLSKQVVAGLSAGLMCLLLMPNLAAAQNRMPDPTDPPSPQGPLSTVSIADAVMDEGNEGVSVLRFKVSVSPESPVPIVVNYQLADRTARWTDGDYQSISGSVTIPAHTTSTEIPVTVFGDGVSEPDETFALIVSSASNSQIARGVATATIVNDDVDGGGGGPRHMPGGEESGGISILPDPTEPPSSGFRESLVSISDESAEEGNDGATVLKFKVQLSAPSAVPITLAYELSDRTATCADRDFQNASGVVTIPAHKTSSVIAVTVFGDQTFESNESFVLMVSRALNAEIARGTATGTIVNDDLASGGGGGRRRLPSGMDDRRTTTEGQLGRPSEASFGLACANPVRGLPSFRFALGRSSRVSIALYDLAGRLVGTPVEGVFAAGTHVQTWSQYKPAPGIYLARLRTDDQALTQRIHWLD